MAKVAHKSLAALVAYTRATTAAPARSVWAGRLECTPPVMPVPEAVATTVVGVPEQMATAVAAPVTSAA